jgi:hypothetical protein
MPKQEDIIRGTPEEREIYWQVKKHYDLAREDLDARMPDWNKKDELFRSHINEKGWPYQAMVFDPRVFTAIYEKSARLFANKPRGRMIPREGGDVLGAKINNELLSFQWDEAERVDDEPMLGKWARMDMNARKYGASFALCKWHYEERDTKDDKGKPAKEVWFDSPTFKPWNNRDVLHNPSYSSVRKWIQLREWITLNELQTVNDAARKRPIYKNLDILKDALTKEARGGGDMRSTAWTSKNLAIRGVQDYMGRDEVFKVVEIVTEYRDQRWITFAPRYGVIIRDIPNPYEHGRIPVVQLKYYPIDEDIYGLSEIEPIEKLQRATNALINQYLDAINMGLYNPIKVRTAAVQMHTLEFGPGKKWLMNDPATDVMPYETSAIGVSEFAQTYRFMIGAMQEALGETSAAVSNLVPGQQEKTATEIKDLALQRNARDNFNQLFLAEALKDQMMLWYGMNKQFLFAGDEQQKVIRIVGQDAVEFFERMGIGGTGLTQDAIDNITSPEMEEVIADPSFDVNSLMEPLFPVSTPQGNIPKFVAEEDGSSGHIVLEPEDLSGNYDYIPEVRSMTNPDAEQVQALQTMILQAKDPASVQIRLQEGQKLRLVDLEKDFFELLGLKDASKYYEKAQPPIVQEGGVNGETIPGGGEAAAGGQPFNQASPGGGVPKSTPPVPRSPQR